MMMKSRLAIVLCCLLTLAAAWPSHAQPPKPQQIKIAISIYITQCRAEMNCSGDVPGCLPCPYRQEHDLALRRGRLASGQVCCWAARYSEASILRNHEDQIAVRTLPTTNTTRTTPSSTLSNEFAC